jgi:hypothetical protein
MHVLISVINALGNCWPGHPEMRMVSGQARPFAKSWKKKRHRKFLEDSKLACTILVARYAEEMEATKNANL